MITQVDKTQELYRPDYYRSTAALPTVRFPPASVTEERAQFSHRPRWADVWPTVALILLLLSLYVALHVSKAGWGGAVLVLTVALWPARQDTRPSKRLYAWQRGAFLVRLRGDAETDRYFDGRG